MINKTKYILLILIASIFLIGILGLSSCEKIIEIDLGESKTRLVVNSVLKSDSIISVHLSASRHILDNAGISFISGASVRLYEDNVFIGNMNHTKNGRYEANYVPVQGKEYSIKVSFSDYDDIFANTTVPDAVSIISVDTLTGIGEWGNEVYYFTIRFADPIGENYYMLQMRQRYLSEIWNPDIVVYDTLYVSEDTIIVHTTYGAYELEEFENSVWFYSDDIIIEEQWNSAIFSDALIEGKPYSLRVSVDKWNFYGESNTVFFDLISLDRNAYLYYLSFARHMWNQGDPFAEPVVVYTNIENGIGVFGSSSAHTKSINVPGYNDSWYY